MNQFMNPYLTQFNPSAYSMTQPSVLMPQTQMQTQQVTRVNGRNGAAQYQMGANSSALLLDESGTIVWLATTDGAGYKTVTPYDITPHQDAPSPDYGSLENRVKKLEELMNERTADTSAAGRKKSAGKSDDGTD